MIKIELKDITDTLTQSLEVAIGVLNGSLIEDSYWADIY